MNKNINQNFENVEQTLNLFSYDSKSSTVSVNEKSAIYKILNIIGQGLTKDKLISNLNQDKEFSNYYQWNDWSDIAFCFDDETKKISSFNQSYDSSKGPDLNVFIIDYTNNKVSKDTIDFLVSGEMSVNMVANILKQFCDSKKVSEKNREKLRENLKVLTTDVITSLLNGKNPTNPKINLSSTLAKLESSPTIGGR